MPATTPPSTIAIRSRIRTSTGCTLGPLAKGADKKSGIVSSISDSHRGSRRPRSQLKLGNRGGDELFLTLEHRLFLARGADGHATHISPALPNTGSQQI